MADNIPAMEDGELEEECTPAAHKDAPREAFAGMLMAAALSDCPAG